MLVFFLSFFFFFTQGITKKMSEFNLNSLSPSPDCKEETLQKLRQTLPEVRQYLG